MTALAANFEMQEKDVSRVISVVTALSTTIFKGALVKFNAAGLAAPCAVEAASMFAGVALEKITTGASTSLEVRVARKGVFLMTLAGAPTIANVGDVFFANDDNACQILGGGINRQKVGVLVYFVSATQGWIEIDDGTDNPSVSAS